MSPYETVKEVMKLYMQWMQTRPVVVAGDFGEVLKKAPKEFLKWYKQKNGGKMPNKPKAAQKRHIQLGQRLEWNGQWCFDEEPGELLEPLNLQVEVLTKEQIAPNGQRVYKCRVYAGPDQYISQTYYINEGNLGETVK